MRAESVARAVSQKQLQLENVEKQFEYACYAAERICEGSKREATASLLKEVQDRQAELAARISGQAEPKGKYARGLSCDSTMLVLTLCCLCATQCCRITNTAHDAFKEKR